MRIKPLIRLVLLPLLPGIVSAQAIITIGPAGNFFISAGQLVSFDSLVLTPSSAYNFSGSNTITHNDNVLDDVSELQTYILRSYDFSNGLSSFDGNMAIYYQPSELNGANASLLQLIGYTTSWNQYGSTAGTNYATATGMSDFSANEVTLGYFTELAINWLSATARREQGLTRIDWTTADETDCRNYQVQRSLTGSGWTAVSPPIGALNQPGPNQYSWMDTTKLTGSLYYRIAETGFDGQSTYSIIMAVSAANAPGWRVYPNPVQSVLYISPGDPRASPAPEITYISICDITGRRILTIIPATGDLYSVNVSGLRPGCYNVSAKFADGTTLSTLFIKR